MKQARGGRWGAWVAATTAATVVAAMASALLAAGPAQAQGSERVIEVRVANGQIQVPEQEVRINRRQGAIRWQLSTPGHTFPDNGIVIQNAGSAFDNCKPLHQGTSFKCVRRGHVDKARYKYEVNVNRGSTALPTLDPIIQNE